MHCLFKVDKSKYFFNIIKQTKNPSYITDDNRGLLQETLRNHYLARQFQSPSVQRHVEKYSVRRNPKSHDCSSEFSPAVICHLPRNCSQYTKLYKQIIWLKMNNTEVWNYHLNCMNLSTMLIKNDCDTDSISSMPPSSWRPAHQPFSLIEKTKFFLRNYGDGTNDLRAFKSKLRIILSGTSREDKRKQLDKKKELEQTTIRTTMAL